MCLMGTGVIRHVLDTPKGTGPKGAHLLDLSFLVLLRDPENIADS